MLLILLLCKKCKQDYYCSSNLVHYTKVVVNLFYLNIFLLQYLFAITTIHPRHGSLGTVLLLWDGFMLAVNSSSEPQREFADTSMFFRVNRFRTEIYFEMDKNMNTIGFLLKKKPSKELVSFFYFFLFQKKKTKPFHTQ